MSDEVLKAIISMLGQGGVEAASVVKWYLFLFSPFAYGVVAVLVAYAVAPLVKRVTIYMDRD